MIKYDERDLLVRLERLGREEKTAFAAACAERLLPVFSRYVKATGEGDLEVLSRIVERVWGVVGGSEDDLTGLREVAVDMYPDDDAPGEWVLEGAYGQNGAAAVAYAVDVWLSDDAQRAAWAARQVFDAAEYAADPPALGLVIEEANAPGPALDAPVVRLALEAIEADLSEIEHFGTGSLAALRDRVQAEVPRWIPLFP